MTDPTDDDRLPSLSRASADERSAQLRALFPEAFPKGRLDADRLRAALGEPEEPPDGERYGLRWAGRAEALRACRMAATETLVPDPAASVDFANAPHVVIEGDNLEVLKRLQAGYHGRVKMIYIDPPYNTGSDFVYADNFQDTQKDYLRASGQTNAVGDRLAANPETGGRFHSRWLTMLYPRLFLARSLLADDGVIFVSIDDHELHNLRLLMNEIFGEECFKNCAVFRRGAKSVQAQFETLDALAVGHEYVLLYAKNGQTRLNKLQIALDDAKPGTWNNHWRGTDRPTMRYELFGITPASGQWRWSRARSLVAVANYEQLRADMGATREPSPAQIDAWYAARQAENNGEEVDLLRLSATGKPEHYVAPSETKMGSDLWTDLSPRGSTDLKALFGGAAVFDNPKPVALIRRMLGFTTNAHGGDMVLDFFAGSGTTGQAVLEANAEDGGDRRFVLVQLPETLPPNALARRFGCETIADVTRERVRRALKATQNAAGFRAFTLAGSAFKRWDPENAARCEADDLARQLEDSVNPLIEGRAGEQDVLFELLQRVGLPLTVPIEARDVAGQIVHVVGNGDLLVCLADPIHDATLDALMALGPARVWCLDHAFNGGDARKTNALLAMKARDIVFQTV